MNKNTLVVVTGPTAVGKTYFAFEIAKSFRTEIISADSRQVYKELNIGVAKPPAAMLQQIPHHFISHVSISEDYNAGRFESEALALLNSLFQRHSIVVLCGGSGLYIDAVCSGLDCLPAADASVRDFLVHMYQQHGIWALQSLLQHKDPVYFEQVDKHNPRRLIRALEVCLITGQPYSSLRKKERMPRTFQTIYLGLQLDRKQLYQRINERVWHMVKLGLEEEARALYPYRNYRALQTVGYEEWFEFFDGRISREQVIGLIQQHTRQYAKRQITWLRKYKEIRWFSPDDIHPAISWLIQTVEN